jgi:t-SNARE complex subunit (syntaxin)
VASITFIHFGLGTPLKTARERLEKWRRRLIAIVVIVKVVVTVCIVVLATIHSARGGSTPLLYH